jgi:hypothetical protein
MKGIMQFSLSSHHLTPLRYKYSPQHPILTVNYIFNTSLPSTSKTSTAVSTVCYSRTIPSMKFTQKSSNKYADGISMLILVIFRCLMCIRKDNPYLLFGVLYNPHCGNHTKYVLRDLYPVTWHKLPSFFQTAIKG